MSKFAPRWPYSIDKTDPLAQGLVYVSMVTRECSPDSIDLMGAQQILTNKYNDGVAPLQTTLEVHPGVSPWHNDEPNVDSGDHWYTDDTTSPVLEAIRGDTNTISAWCYPDDEQVRQGVCGSGNQAFTMQQQWGSTGLLLYQQWGYAYTTDSVFEAGKLVHLVRVWDAAGSTDADKLRVYKNGELLSLTYSGTLESASSAPRFVLYNAQNSASSSWQYAWTGGIFDFRVYDRALSASEARMLSSESSRWSIYQEGPIVRAAAAGDPTAALSGTMLTAPPEDIRTTGGTLVITLTDDTWSDPLNLIDKLAIQAGVVSDGSEPTGWNAEVQSFPTSSVVRTSDTVATLTYPASPDYAISADETITCTVPATAVASATSYDATPTFTIDAGLAVAVTGTATDTVDEQDIRNGAKTIILTVNDDTWVSGASFDAARQAIIDGLDSAQSETTGWNTEVRDNLNVTTVVRTSDTVVTITLSGQSSYDITAQETITVTVPLTALATAPEDPVIAIPTFTVDPYVVTVALTGTVVGTDEDDIVAGGKTVILTLTGDTWVAYAGGFGFDLHRQAIIDGLDSAQSEGTGWNAEVRDKEVVGSVIRTSDTVVTITLTAAAAYDITANEMITSTVPALALTKQSLDLTASPSFTIVPVGGGGGGAGGSGVGSIFSMHPRTRGRRAGRGRR